MSQYCKAYSIKELRKFHKWKEKKENARTEKKVTNGKEIEAPRKLSSDDYLYLHENYVVTDGIFADKNIIFNSTTKEWKNFCENDLKFRIPDFVTNKIQEGDSGKDDKAKS
jgi:hypothetical protein